jgi:hypothetical protein
LVLDASPEPLFLNAELTDAARRRGPLLLLQRAGHPRSLHPLLAALLDGRDRWRLL